MNTNTAMTVRCDVLTPIDDEPGLVCDWCDGEPDAAYQYGGMIVDLCTECAS